MKSKQWKHPGSLLLRVHSAGKVMTSIFWDSQWVFMIDYHEQGCTINSAFYTGELRQLHQEIARTDSKCSALAGQRPCSHITSCHDCCYRGGFEILPHPPYSPVMAPSDFYPFPKLKSHLHGIQYGSNEIDIEAINITEGTRKGLSILKG